MDIVNEMMRVRTEVLCETQEQFAERIGVSRTTLVNIEKGKQKPSRLTAGKIIKVIKEVEESD